ncbi:hypothetical protein TSOC_005945 [Tetrabaena socialis]|uniref:Uncharacterized protein n=1 Tax=Tetrabaena socialis TaxID=47790 RepID=A0A2J8A4Y9_9CHLO|nr:hypothetical protein TSOC_005945 [Tetrabaena socialis]|eukprot:PNH07602.1 hypothetical protein TSOC_005945 [Tetrabaena socialis]
MDTLALNGNADVLRRALSLAIPVGQLGSELTLKTLATAGKAGFWGVTSAAKIIGRTVLSPLGSLAFGSGSAAVVSSKISFCTQPSCPQLICRRHHASRSEAKLLKAASGLRSGSAKCSIKKQGAAAVQPALFALLSMPCAPPSEHEHPSSEEVADWTVTSLGLQSSML